MVIQFTEEGEVMHPLQLAILKEVATKYFDWWYNQPGMNSEDAFDHWWKTKGAATLKAKFRLSSPVSNVIETPYFCNKFFSRECNSKCFKQCEECEKVETKFYPG